jgi:hypothetical protein
MEEAMRRYAMWLGLLCTTTGCAFLSRDLSAVYNPETGRYETPKEETVYVAPVEDAMLMVRRILEEQRYDVMASKGGLELFTSAHEPGKNIPGTRAYERYYVQGESVAPRQSVVRVFRLRYNEMEDTVETPTRAAGTREEELRKADEGNPLNVNLTTDPFKSSVPDMERFRFVRGMRDVGIEQLLLQRLEMVPALELVGGNASVPARSVILEGWTEASETTQAPECASPVEGAAPLMTRGQTVLLADPLGTRELPSAALRMLCEAASKGLPVTLALSLPSTEQPLLDRYLASAGTSQDAQALLSDSSFWRRVYQDGRSSRAMLWLVEQARRLRASGRAVSLVAFDVDQDMGGEREAWMARRLVEHHRKHPDGWMLVLAGGEHVRTTREGREDDFEPMGLRLARALPSVKALDVGFQRGTQYSCRYSVWEDVECNLFAISPTDEARQLSRMPSGVKLFPKPLEEGFHGRLYVGALSASPPALQVNATTARGAAPGVAP